MRSALVNQLHGLMAEFGIALPRGWREMLHQAGELLAEECADPELLRGRAARANRTDPSLERADQDSSGRLAAGNDVPRTVSASARSPGSAC